MRICLIWFFTSQSTIFQLCPDGSSWVEPVFTKQGLVLSCSRTQCSDAGENHELWWAVEVSRSVELEHEKSFITLGPVLAHLTEPLYLLWIFPFLKLDSSWASATLYVSVSSSRFFVRHCSTYLGLTAGILYLLHCLSLYTQLVFFLLNTTKNEAWNYTKMIRPFPCFFVVRWFFSKSTVTKNSFRNTVRVSNSLDPMDFCSAVITLIIFFNNWVWYLLLFH